MLNYTGQRNPIFPGAQWVTILQLKAATPWTAADEDPDSWRLRIHPTREGGDAAILAGPAALARDPGDDTKLDMRFELTGDQTIELVSVVNRLAAVEVEQIDSGGDWKPTPGMSGTANVRHLPGAAI